MTISREQKLRVEKLATTLLSRLNDVGDGDATESLAALYGACQVLERELLGRGHLDLRELAHIQLAGKRIGASMTVDIEEEVLDAPPEEEDIIH